MQRLSKTLLLRIGKAIGLFRVARWLTRGQLRVLCYHGFALRDEDQFLPDLFVTGDFFRDRLQRLVDEGYEVIDLEQATILWEKGGLPDYPIVITIDDGFYSVYAVAADILSDFGFPATLYVSSYYVQKGTPIFGLLLRYIAWKGRHSTSPQAVIDAMPELAGYHGAESANHFEIASFLWEYGEKTCSEEGQQQLAKRFADLLDVDYHEIDSSRILSLINNQEIKYLDENGIGIELHTHRHRFPVDDALARDEVARNRAVLEPIAGRPMRHFCYPSGDWSTLHWPILESLGVSSATTCDREFVQSRDSRYAMPRILDDSRMSALEFEAEVSGFLVLLRRLRSSLRT